MPTTTCLSQESGDDSCERPPENCGIVENEEDSFPFACRISKHSTKVRQRRESWQDFQVKKVRAHRPPNTPLCARHTRLSRSRRACAEKSDLGELPRHCRGSKSRGSYRVKREMLRELPGWTIRTHSLSVAPTAENENNTDHPCEEWEDESTLPSSDGTYSSSSQLSISSSLRAVTSVSSLVLGLPTTASSSENDESATHSEEAGDSDGRGARPQRRSTMMAQWEAECVPDQSFVAAIVVENPISVEPVVFNPGDSAMLPPSEEDIELATNQHHFTPSSSADENGREADKERRLRTCQLRTASLLLLSVTLVTLVVAVIVATTGLGTKGDNFLGTTRSTDPATISPSAASVDVVSAPSPSPLLSSSVPPLATETQARFETLVEIVEDAMTVLSEEAGRKTALDLRNEKTPQAKAASWMASQDQVSLEELAFFAQAPEKIKAFWKNTHDGGTDSLDNSNDEEATLHRRQILLDRFAALVLVMQSADAALLDSLKLQPTCEWKHFRALRIDPALGSCLQEIDFNRKSNLTGTLPPELALLSSLRKLHLMNLQLTGPLPTVWGYGLRHLESFVAPKNEITGVVPSSWSRLSKLKEVMLGNNRIESVQGFLPHPKNGTEEEDEEERSLWFSSLKQFSFESNALLGHLLEDFAHLMGPSSTRMIFRNNNVNGTIPSWFGNLLQGGLDLGRNSLDGTIPPSLFQNLKSLKLNDNLLTGPAFPSNLDGGRLQRLELQGNRLTGTIPSAIWHYSMENLDLSRNQISGTLPPPPVVGGRSLWRSLRVAGNSLTGTIPPRLPFFIASDDGTIVLDLSDNNFTGTIPSSLVSHPDAKLSVVMLQGNQLSGTVPHQLLNLRGLRELRMERNNLHGNISFLCHHENPRLQIFADCDGANAPVMCDCCENCPP